MKYIMAAALIVAASANAQSPNYEINASLIVTGTPQTINWGEVASLQGGPAPLGYEYSTLSSVWNSQLPLIILGPWIFYRPAWYAGSGWAPQPSPNVQQPVAAVKAVPTVPFKQGNWNAVYANNYVLRAAVDFPNSDGVAAEVSNGSAYADFNYRISEVNEYGTAEDYFLLFPTPKSKRNVQPAYNLCCSGDSNGGTYNYLNPQSASSTSALDVYVDGLPVFSTASFLDHPATYTNPLQNLETSFGTTPSTPNVLIYLGKLPAGTSFNVDLVMHAEATANAPQCGTEDFPNLFPPTVQYNCFDLDETFPIPSAGSSISFKVFALQL